jgi:hypothetical protein
LTDSFSAEATDKRRQEVPETVATEGNGNETQLVPADGAMDQPQPDFGQSHLSFDDCMNQIQAVSYAEDQQSLVLEETTRVPSTQHATALVKIPEAVDIRCEYIIRMCETGVMSFCN